MKADKIIKFLHRVEEEVKPYGKTLKDVEINFRRSDDSDVEQIDSIGVDLYDAKKNRIIESVILMGKY